MSTSSKTSFWIDNHVAQKGGLKDFPRLKDVKSENINREFDVVVIGAGWFGLNTALKLHEHGRKVLLLEGGKVASSSVASWSTAKVTSQHRIKYSSLAHKHGKETAQLYYQANHEAISDMEETIKKYNIDCQWARAAHVVFAQTGDELDTLKQEERALQDFPGSKVSLEQNSIKDLPESVKIYGALRVEDQAHVNPVSYLSAIANKLAEEGVPIYENSRVNNVSFSSPHEITVEGGHNMTANNVVVATHMPILDRTGHFAKGSPSRSYCIAVTLENDDKMIKDTYISVSSGSKTVSLRPAADGKVLVAAGGGHPVGEYPSDEL